jgi:hypothetical protein
MDLKIKLYVLLPKSNDLCEILRVKCSKELPGVHSGLHLRDPKES